MKPPEKKPPVPARRPYSAPKLVIYGDAVTLTQASKLIAGQKDGGKGVKMRTR
jgi:hypothetical protein